MHWHLLRFVHTDVPIRARKKKGGIYGRSIPLGANLRTGLKTCVAKTGDNGHKKACAPRIFALTQHRQHWRRYKERQRFAKRSALNHWKDSFLFFKILNKIKFEKINLCTRAHYTMIQIDSVQYTRVNKFLTVTEYNFYHFFNFLLVGSKNKIFLNYTIILKHWE